MFKFALHFIKRVLSSRLGRILCVIHLILFAYAIYLGEPVPPARVGCGTWTLVAKLIAGRMFAFHYEWSLLYVLLHFDFPAMILSAVLARTLLSPLNDYLCDYARSWVAAANILACASVQWWIMGYFIEWVLRKRKIYK